MAFNQVTATSLTPSRPAPAAPVRRGTDIGNALASSGYGSSFSVGMSSPSSSSYGSSYSGIGASPIRNTDMYSGSEVVRAGVVAVKEDGIVSWLWRPKWLVLKEGTLSIHKSEVSPDHSDRLLQLPQPLLRTRAAPCPFAVAVIAIARLRVLRPSTTAASVCRRPRSHV